MSKNALVKFVILLVVATLVYSVFWFFKAGQLQKQVNGFVSQNGNYVSVGEVAVSGFPLAQKVTVKDLKFSFPGSLVKRQTMVKHLEAKAGIFSSDFTVTLPEAVTVQDADNNSSTVEFSKDPEISLSLADGRIAKFNYQDFGYRIADAEKNTIYAASSTLVTLEAVVGADEIVTHKITANIKDIEGFNVVDIYKNIFEKKITEGLKTGEIVLGSSAVAVEVAPAVVDPMAVDPNAVVAMAPVVDPAAAPVAAPDAAMVAAMDPNAVAPAAAPAPEKLAETATDSNLVKNNLVAAIEYSLIPNKDDQKAQIPTDPTQIGEVPMQHNKAIKITNLEFSNPLYKISMNGEMHAMADDNMPSGSLAIKVEKIDNLINHLVIGLNQLNEQKKPATATEVQAVDLAGNGTLTADAYQNFLTKFTTGLSPVFKELAAKNAVSKDDVAQYDIRREKNLEFLVNETPIREILGKF